MSLKLTKSSIAILILSLLALVSMSFNFTYDTFYEIIGSRSYFHEEKLLFAWIYLVSFALIIFFSFISKTDFALLFSGINLVALIVLFMTEIILSKYPDIGFGMILLAVLSIAILIICYKNRKTQNKQSNQKGASNEN